MATGRNFAKAHRERKVSFRSGGTIRRKPADFDVNPMPSNILRRPLELPRMEPVKR